jgi:hypothetical protein
VLLPIFLLVETRAEDPVINLSYFRNARIVVTLILSMVVGFVLMGIIFVPQFAENALKIASGSGGYFVIILSVFAGVGAPFSGRIIDKVGAKPVLAAGFLLTIVGALYLMFVTIPYPTFLNVGVCLALLGLGLGFTIGTPLNYMMLENTDPAESNSALATLSLVRSIATAIAPAIMVAFLAHAGMDVQANVMKQLPTEVVVQPLKNAAELTAAFDKLKSDPAMAAKLKDVSFPDFSAAQTIAIDMNKSGGSSGSTALPADLIEQLKSADVTNITDLSKTLAVRMFAQTTPDLVTKIQGGVQSGIDALTEQSAALNPAIPALKAAKAGIDGTIAKMVELQADVPVAFDNAKNDYLVLIDARKPAIQKAFQDTLNIGFKNVYLTTIVASLLAMFLLLFYRKKKEQAI